MNDEQKLCANCGHQHRWGILRHSQDGVPLYGARPCYCHCDQFVERNETLEAFNVNLPTMTQAQTKALWEETSFLNAQTPAAIRIAVKQIQDLGKDKEGINALMAQMPEFMGFMMSSVSNMVGAYIRSDGKFSHLVAHTDEIVEAMKGVVQLKERLDTIYAIQERVLEAVGKLYEKVAKLDKPSLLVDMNPLFDAALVCQRCRHLKDEHTDGRAWCRNATTVPSCECDQFTLGGEAVSIQEAAHVFASKSAPLWNEPIAVEPTPDNVASGEAGKQFAEDMLKDMKERGYNLEELHRIAKAREH